MTSTGVASERPSSAGSVWARLPVVDFADEYLDSGVRDVAVKPLAPPSSAEVDVGTTKVAPISAMAASSPRRERLRIAGCLLMCPTEADGGRSAGP